VVAHPQSALQVWWRQTCGPAQARIHTLQKGDRSASCRWRTNRSLPVRPGRQTKQISRLTSSTLSGIVHSFQARPQCLGMKRELLYHSPFFARLAFFACHVKSDLVEQGDSCRSEDLNRAVSFLEETGVCSIITYTRRISRYQSQVLCSLHQNTARVRCSHFALPISGVSLRL
jgi:hypothetical protein